MSASPSNWVVACPESNLLDRVEYCRVMLSAHGFLTLAEKQNVKRRIAKWVTKHNVRLRMAEETAERRTR